MRQKFLHGSSIIQQIIKRQTIKMRGLPLITNLKLSKFQQASQEEPLCISQIEFRKNRRYKALKISSGQKSSNYSKRSQEKSLPRSNTLQESKSRLCTESASEQISRQPTSLTSQDLKIQLPKHFPQGVAKSLMNKMQDFCLEKSLQRRAKQFVKVVNNQKSQIQGRLFVLKQKEREKRSKQQQLEQYQRDLIKSYCKQKRKSLAEEHINKLLERQKERASRVNNIKKSKIQSSSSKLGTNHSGDKKSELGKKGSFPSTPAQSCFIMEQGKQMYGKPFWNQSKRNKKKQYQPDEQIQIQKVWGKLAELNKLFQKQEHLMNEEMYIDV